MRVSVCVCLCLCVCLYTCEKDEWSDAAQGWSHLWVGDVRGADRAANLWHPGKYDKNVNIPNIFLFSFSMH